MTKEILTMVEQLMKKSLDKFRSELISIRGDRASITLVQNIQVECYNSQLPLNQVSNIIIPDTKTIEIRPWDTSILPAIEKAIFSSKIGITPVNDGKCIRLTIPPMTEERRKEIVKHIKKIAEEFHNSIRNERRKGISAANTAEKEKKITEDERYKLEEKLQKLTEQYIKQIDEMVNKKEKEIMQ